MKKIATNRLALSERFSDLGIDLGIYAQDIIYHASERPTGDPVNVTFVPSWFVILGLCDSKDQ